MQWQTLSEDWINLPLGRSKIVLRATVRRGDAYGAMREILEKRLVRIAGDAVQELDGLSELKTVADQEQLSFIDEVTRRPADYANLLAEYSDLGMVLKPIWRHFVFREQYGIDLEANAPRVSNETLRFISVRMGLYEPTHPLVDVSWNLKSLAIITEISRDNLF